VNSIRLLPIVILAVAALLILKTVGIVTQGGYVLTGVARAEAAGGEAEAVAAGEPTMQDSSPTLESNIPTLGGEAEPDASHDAAISAGVEPLVIAPVQPPDGNVIATLNACDPRPAGGEDDVPTADGQMMIVPADCPLPSDAVPQVLTPGGPVQLSSADATPTERALLERLAARRTELDAYAQELAMRASLVDAAEKRIDERQTTLQSIEDQIASLVEQRKAMEEGQFASIVAMYGTMKPKDAAAIFDQLDMEVLVRVAKMMTPRKMAPILAAMNTGRAQDLTVRLASAEANPLDSMTSDDLAALPQIVGQ
jgi:flagellar motility protein MotE (MotC chaperone)